MISLHPNSRPLIQRLHPATFWIPIPTQGHYKGCKTLQCNSWEGFSMLRTSQLFNRCCPFQGGMTCDPLEFARESVYPTPTHQRFRSRVFMFCQQRRYTHPLAFEICTTLFWNKLLVVQGPKFDPPCEYASLLMFMWSSRKTITWSSAIWFRGHCYHLKYDLIAYQICLHMGFSTKHRSQDRALILPSYNEQAAFLTS